MKIVIIGTGYVGLVSGACFSELGFHVTCVDANPEKVSMLNNNQIPIYEPGLESLVTRNREAGRLLFTGDLPSAVKDATIIFIAVGTPTQEDGAADLKYVFGAAEEIARSLKQYALIVTKSTVPVDTANKLQKLIAKINPQAEFDVASNPEFLREGSAIEDFMMPDRVVVGTYTTRAENLMKRLYQPLIQRNTSILYTTPETAELIKYAANSFLATKITFINEIANLCEVTGTYVQDVARGIGLDSRIGQKFLNVGPGYGGSCFPKDTMALLKTADDYNVELSVVGAVVKSNSKRKKEMAAKILNVLRNDSKTLAILGVTFKADTDDMRDSPSLEIIPILQEAGYQVKAYDPEGMENGKKLLNDVVWCSSVNQATQGADAAIILTEWNEFRSLDLSKLKANLNHPLLIDFRNLYDPLDVTDQGLDYVSLGRPPKLGREI